MISMRSSKLAEGTKASEIDNNTETINTLNSYGELIVTEGDLQKIPTEVMFPDELNSYLREQIHYYAHENAMVKQNLADLETDYDKTIAENAALKEKLRNYETTMRKDPFATSNQVATSKIVELTKKIREKTAEVESLKTKYSKLERNLLDIKRDARTQEPIVEKSIEAVHVPPCSMIQFEDEMRKLQDKLNQVNNKLIDTRNHNFQLKNDLKMANKWLQQEVGESFESLQALNSSGGNWRGRSQIICDLQRKNSELKDKLRGSQDKINVTSEATLSVKTESKINDLSKENGELQTKFDDLKKKHEAAKARIRVLDTDHGLLKSKFNMLKEQSDKDQKFIETLSAQLVNKDIKPEKTQKDRLLKKLQTENNQLMKEIEEFKIVIRDLKRDIDSRVKEIEKLRKSQPESILVENTANKRPEIQKLLQIIEQQNQRLTGERNSHAKTQYLLNVEKQRATKAEAFAAKVELDSNRSGTYSSGIFSKGANLRDQLELCQENLKALQTRFEIEQFERKSDFEEFKKLLQEYVQNDNVH